MDAKDVCSSGGKWQSILGSSNWWRKQPVIPAIFAIPARLNASYLAGFDCVVSGNSKTRVWFFGKPAVFYRLVKIRALEPLFCGIWIPRQPLKKAIFDPLLARGGI